MVVVVTRATKALMGLSSSKRKIGPIRFPNLKPRQKGQFLGCALSPDEEKHMHQEIKSYTQKYNLHPNPKDEHPPNYQTPERK